MRANGKESPKQAVKKAGVWGEWVGDVRCDDQGGEKGRVKLCKLDM